jgi:metallo-beta-lactamase family protein
VCEDGITKTLLFSGDVGNVDRPLIRDPQLPEKADIVVIESTYGDRLHGPRIDYKEQLSAIINETVGKGGNLVIPSFAVGRTQELLYLIREMKAEGRIPRSLPVILDSPLAVEATKLYAGGLDDYYDAETLAHIAKGENILSFENLRLSVTKEDSVAINEDADPKIIISSSGMCEAGRIRHHLKHNLWRAESTVLFVGYQSVGTLGRILVDGAETVRLFGEEVCVNARIATLEGISGHADRDMLLNWLKALKTRPEAVFVNHGSDTVCDKFAAEIQDSLRVFAVAPFNGGCYDLATMECLNEGNQVRINKEKFRAAQTSPAFEKLVLAGKQLMAIIERNRGGANKDLGKFTSQINDLCRKWER